MPADLPLEVAREAQTGRTKSWNFSFSISAVIVATLLFSWPSLINGGPFFLADTSAYVRSADAAVTVATGYSSSWSNKQGLYTAGSGEAQSSERAQPLEREGPIHPPLLGRSIYYGAIVYILVVPFTELAAVLFQSALTAIVIWLATFPLNKLHKVEKRTIYYLGVCALLSLFTPVPFVTSLIMPDYLTGLGMASLILMMCFWMKYSASQKWTLAAVLLLAALAHTSNILLIFAALVAGLVLRLIGQPVSNKALLIGAAAALCGITGEGLFSAAVHHEIGVRPIRPPFLTARLVNDGPGYELIRGHCGTLKFTACKYADRMPYDSDYFLWSLDKQNGVFSAIDIPDRRRLSQQDARFALATLREYPFATLQSSARATFRQLTLLDLRHWAGTASNGVSSVLDNLPAEVANRMGQTRHARGEMPTEAFEILSIGFLLLCIPVAAAMGVVAYRSQRAEPRVFATALLIVGVLLLANATVSGALSKPDARYALRIVWILPLFTALWIGAVLDPSRSSRAGAGRTD